jgi:tRNA-specific 2-thiouridylase
MQDEAFVDDVVLARSVSLPLEARVRVRYRHDGAAAKIKAHPLGARIAFDAPVRAITSGQVAVFYDGDRVLGGGRIARAPQSKPINKLVNETDSDYTAHS